MTIDKDILIGRVVDQEATDADWRALHEQAEQDPSIWRELAQAQRDHAELGAELEGALACADTVEIPGHEHYSRSLTERIRVVTTWSGWVAAAVMLLAWTGVLGPAPQESSETGAQRGEFVPIPAGKPEAALDYYLDEGRKMGSVVGEVPERVVLDVVLDGDGAGHGATVIYLRQIVERCDVDKFYTYGVDELGRPDPNVTHPVILKERRASQPY